MSLTEIQSGVTALYEKFNPLSREPYTDATEEQLDGYAQQMNARAPQLTLKEVADARDILEKMHRVWVQGGDRAYTGAQISFFPTKKELLKRELEIWAAGRKNYQVAASKIADVYAKKGEEIDLSNLDLEDLPEGMGVIDFREINVSKNKLHTLPVSLANCEYLKILNAAENQLESLPNTLGKCTRLQKLYLSQNRLSSLPDSLCECSNLEVLTLDANPLIRLPNAVSQWVILKHLDLRGNPSLTTLPPSLGELSELKDLFAPEQLQTAHAAVVKQIACTHSVLEAYVKGILAWRSPNTQEFLNVMRCHNDAMAFFTGKLDWSCAKLTSIPDCIGLCGRLCKLDLSHNELRALPDSLGECTALRILMLGWNKLSALPNLRGCTQLKDLYLSFNQFTALPDYLPTLPRLKFLEVGGNPELKDLPDTFGTRYIDTLIYETQISYDRLPALQKQAKRAAADGDDAKKRSDDSLSLKKQDGSGP